MLLEPSVPNFSRRESKEGAEEWAMVTIRHEMTSDIDAREYLLDRVWGASRFAKTAERLREGREPSTGLSFVAEHDGDLAGTVRLWDICAGPGRPALLLGPLAVDETARSRGIGAGRWRQRDAASIARCSWLATRPITSASVSRPK
jgi:predicted N-acetyltransferase YhbS